jgi:hypothetical protein
MALLPDLMWASREPTGRFLGLPGRPDREVFTAIRAGAAGRPALRAIRAALKEVATRQQHDARTTRGN